MEIIYLVCNVGNILLVGWVGLGWDTWEVDISEQHKLKMKIKKFVNN